MVRPAWSFHCTQYGLDLKGGGKGERRGRGGRERERKEVRRAEARVLHRALCPGRCLPHPQQRRRGSGGPGPSPHPVQAQRAGGAPGCHRRRGVGKGASGEALSVQAVRCCTPGGQFEFEFFASTALESQGPAIRRIVFNLPGHRTAAPPHTGGNTKPPLSPTLSVGQGNT